MKKFFIVAGEPSGDIHAAKLIVALKKIFPESEFIGIGGDSMIDAGLKSLVSIEKMSVVGFWEVAKRYDYFKKILEQCKNIIISENIDAFIPVDYPGFNITLAAYAKKVNIPVIYYIAPQLWAWGKNRAKKLADTVDLLLAVFPFEVDFFNGFGIPTEFVGHPLMDNPTFAEAPPKFEQRENLISFLPGSREQEVRKHLPIMAEIAKIIQNINPEYNIAFSKSKTIKSELFDNLMNSNPDWKIFDNSTDLLLTAKAGVVKTGTSNLEAALCGMPFVMLYKTSLLSYHLSKFLIKLPYISIVNILANKAVIKEEIQNNIRAKNIAQYLLNIAGDRKKHNDICLEFVRIREMLGGKGASENAAKAISRII